MKNVVWTASAATVSSRGGAVGHTNAPQNGMPTMAADAGFSRESPLRAPEGLLTGHSSQPAHHPLLAWLLDHRILLLGVVIAALLCAAMMLPARGTQPLTTLMQGDFASIDPSLRMLAPMQLAISSPDIRRPREATQISPTPIEVSPGAATASAQSLMVGLDFPAGVTAAMPGHGPETQQSSRSLFLAFALSVFLVYLVTASQLESLLNPLAILFTVPMGLIGAAWGLYASGAMLNPLALVGIILLAGILVNNAIVLIDAIKQARMRGTRTREAIIQAGRSRLQPIVITSIITVLGLLPMAIGIGDDVGRRPLTITAIAGVVVVTFLTLVVIPVVRAILDRKPFAQGPQRPPADKRS